MSQTRLRLTSDGTARGTKITTEDGTLIKGVQMVAWQLALDGKFARMQVEFVGVALDVVGLVEVDGSSFPEDPMVVRPQLEVPQDPPEGPGFVDRAPTPEEHATQLYRCPDCGAMYDDPDEICTGDDINGAHDPMKLVPGPTFIEEDAERG